MLTNGMQTYLQTKFLGKEHVIWGSVIIDFTIILTNFKNWNKTEEDYPLLTLAWRFTSFSMDVNVINKIPNDFLGISAFKK